MELYTPCTLTIRAFQRELAELEGLIRLGYDPEVHRARVDSNGNVSF